MKYNAAWLSEQRVAYMTFNFNSFSKWQKCKVHFKPSVRSTYSASADENETIDCFFDFQLIILLFKYVTYPYCDLESSSFA